MELTLIGGPCDGRVVNIHEGMAACAWLCVPQMFPAVHRFERIPDAPVFFVHRYHMSTGIYHDGKMPSERVLPWFTLFGPRLERWLDRLDRRDVPRVPRW